MGHDTWREEFPVVHDTVFFNHSAISAMPKRARDAGVAVFDDRWQRASWDYFRWLDLVEDTRERAARLLGTTASQVAFTGNTSSGLSLVASGLTWNPGDAVAVTWPDFPTVRFACDALRERGVRVVEIPRRNGRVNLDEAAKLIPGCRLVMASTVDWVTGTAVDVAGLVTLCHRAGALCCLDVIQSLGAMPLDVTALGVDFAAAGCHKWQLGPMGLGIFYVVPGLEDLLAPVMVGWRSMEGADHLGDVYRLKANAARFEPGTQDVAAIAAYGASLSLLEEVGADTVRSSIFAVIDALREGLAERGLPVVSPMGEGERSSILAFSHPRAEDLYNYFMQSRVFLSYRGGNIRLAPHFYNDATDVERFFTIMDEFGK